MISIAIIGAGPGGLTLASLLHRNGIPFTVFDLRSKPIPSSAPSGSLDLHEESGLRAIEACGLTSEFQALPTVCSEDLVLTDKHGVISYQDSGSGDRPEVSRTDLTSLLLSSLPPTSIKWDHKLRSAAHVDASSIAGFNSVTDNSNTSNTSTKRTDRWRLNFESQPPQTFDLVIGADGAWSKVRGLLTKTMPHFSGVNCITLTIPNITAKYPSLAEILGHGSYYACGGKNTVMSQRSSQDSVRTYLMISSECESYLSDTDLDSMSPQALKERLLSDPSLFRNWGAELKDLISKGCEEKEPIPAKPLYMLPTAHSWSNVPGLTLLGDAAHLMTPFAGEGVNSAMLDALELAKCIIGAFRASENTSVVMDDAVKTYEVRMFARAAEIAEETWRNLQIIFAEDAPRGFVELMQALGPPRE